MFTREVGMQANLQFGWLSMLQHAEDLANLNSTTNIIPFAMNERYPEGRILI